MKRGDCHVAVVVEEYDDAGPLRIHGSVVSGRHIVTFAGARNDRKWLKWTNLEKVVNVGDHGWQNSWNARFTQTRLIMGIKDSEDRIDVGGVVQKKIRRVGREFRGGVFSGGDGYRAGADRASAGDVVRRVAQHEDAFRREFNSVPFPGAGAGEWPERIPVVVIVGERAEFEIMPDAIVRQLQFRSPFQIAGEQGKDHIFALPQGIEKGQHAREQGALLGWKFEREIMQIPIKKLREIFRGCGQAVRGEHLPGDSRIGAAGDLYRGQIVVDAETVPKTEPDRSFAGASGCQERAVDIEKEECFVQALKLAASMAPAQAKPDAIRTLRSQERRHVLC